MFTWIQQKICRNWEYCCFNLTRSNQEQVIQQLGVCYACPKQPMPNVWLLYKALRLKNPCNAPSSCETPEEVCREGRWSWGSVSLDLLCQKQCPTSAPSPNKQYLTACFSGAISIYSSFLISFSSNRKNNYHMYLNCSLIAKPLRN